MQAIVWAVGSSAFSPAMQCKARLGLQHAPAVGIKRNCSLAQMFAVRCCSQLKTAAAGACVCTLVWCEIIRHGEAVPACRTCLELLVLCGWLRTSAVAEPQ